jgi:hypothetical protein
MNLINHAVKRLLHGGATTLVWRQICRRVGNSLVAVVGTLQGAFVSGCSAGPNELSFDTISQELIGNVQVIACADPTQCTTQITGGGSLTEPFAFATNGSPRGLVGSFPEAAGYAARG